MGWYVQAEKRLRERLCLVARIISNAVLSDV